MVRRSASASFLGDARVFPGGAVDDTDHGPSARTAVRWSGPDEEFPWRAAALRETAEETGIVLGEGSVPASPGIDVYEEIAEQGGHLDADRLVYLSNWVTPQLLSIRFDTRFYVATIGEHARACADLTEVFDPEWVTPEEAMARADDGRWLVEFPTRKHLETLAAFDSTDAVLAYARSLDAIPKIEPRIITDAEGVLRVIVPGEPEGVSR